MSRELLLVSAAERGDIDEVRELLTRTYEAPRANCYGDAALIGAITYRREHVVELLLNWEYDPPSVMTAIDLLKNEPRNSRMMEIVCDCRQIWERSVPDAIEYPEEEDEDYSDLPPLIPC